MDSELIQAIAAAVGVVIALALLLLERQQRTDSWLRTFREHHELFWSDSDMACVRSWIACDQSYAKIAPILSKRLSNAQAVSQEDYKCLEKLDKFFNFLLRARLAYHRGSKSQRLWNQLYLQYWLDEIQKRNRHGIIEYIDMGYERSKAVLYGDQGGVVARLLRPLTKLLHRARRRAGE